MINKAILLGRVGKKDYKQIRSGGYMATLSIATNRKWIDANGQVQQQTTWHNVNFFGKKAEIANNHCNVGDLVYVEGEISNKKVEDGVNAGHWVYSVTGSEIKLLPNAKRNDANNDDSNDDSGIPF